MTTQLSDVTVNEVALVKKGANGKRIFLRKSSNEGNEMEAEALEKAQVALQKAADEQKALAAKVEALEKAQKDAAATAAAEKQALEKAAKDAEDARAVLEKALADEKEAKEVAVAIKKASEDFKNVPEKADELGPLLRKVRKADAESADKLEALLKRCDAAIEKALTPVGVATGAGPKGTALEEIQKRADELVKTGKEKTTAQAFESVLKSDRSLYNRYEREKNAR